jgi:two-component system chemotaxis response regulator CheB
MVAMSATRFIAVGASAGGVESLRRLVAGLPADLDAAVAVVLHLSPTSPGMLPQILARAGPLPVTHAIEGERIEPRHIYVAPPDHHLLVDGDRFRLSRGATENGVRPAVDVLFRSAAISFGRCVVGVVLSGSLDDGTAGLRSIKDHGGKAAVQEPGDATHPAMPSSAIDHVAVDCVATATDLPHLLMGLLDDDACVGPPRQLPAGEELAVPEEIRPNTLTCPDCGGPLEQLTDRTRPRFRCTVGHEWTARALDEAQARMSENSLYNALRIIDERVELTRRMLDRATASRHDHVVKFLHTRTEELERQAEHLRIALRRSGTGEDPSDREAVS